ncbi:MAG TPA: response regulator [Stellaceae bacterium]|nr:response regulator [Stellaceae bacterium]
MTTVLIVDDEALAAEETAEALELAGLSTQWSADPFDAIARAENPAVGVVVTDLRMPGLDGARLIDRLRASRTDLCFVIVTGHGTIDQGPADPPEILARLRKPLDLVALIDLLRLHLAESRDHAE